MKSKKNSQHILFSKVRQLVLGLLYTQPKRAFYTNEIIRLTNSGNGVVQRELEKLIAMGLISAHLSGKQKYYQANKISPLYSDLRGIILKTFGLSDIVCDALKKVSSKIQFAFIYGSIASQKDTATSDIDLMIISETLTYAEIFSNLEVPEKKLNRKINPTFYTKEEWISQFKRKNHFVMQVIKNPKIFLIGNDDEFRQLG